MRSFSLQRNDVNFKFSFHVIIYITNTLYLLDAEYFLFYTYLINAILVINNKIKLLGVILI